MAGPIAPLYSASYYRGLSAVWEKRGIVTVDRRCRMANRANRMVFHLVSGRQVWRGKSIDSESILYKLREFHRTHATPIEQTVLDLNEAFHWLPKSTYKSEAKPMEEIAAKKRRGATSLGDLLVPLLIRLGVRSENPVESNPSEA